MVRYLLAAMILFSVRTTFAIEDDFTDGKWDDGSPFTWSLSDGEAKVVGGDLVLTSIDGEVASMAAQVKAVSMRAQFRIADGYAGIWLPRFSDRALIFSDGTVSTLSSSGPISISTKLKPASRDVVLQIDAIGDSLSVWAWDAEFGPESSDPLIVIPTHSFASATEGEIWARWGETTFRSVTLSNTHLTVVPEPVGFQLIGLAGVLGVTCLRYFPGKQDRSEVRLNRRSSSKI